MLTIAIPTYNRAIFLKECLSCLYKEYENLPGEYKKIIKIYVSDNCSQDSTHEIISEYSNKLWSFSSVSNSENIGAEKNIARCYLNAAGEHVWILGDDDVILPGGLTLIIDVLKNHSPDIVYLNNYGFEKNYLNTPKKFSSNKILLYSDAIKFTKKVNISLTFISAIIVKKIPNYCWNISDTIGGNLIGLAWTLPPIKFGKLFIVMERWVIAARANNTGGYKLANVFGGNLKELTNKILWDKLRIAEIIQNSSLIYLFPFYLSQNRFSPYTLIDESTPNHLKSEFRGNWRYYFFVMPFFKLPKIFIKPYYIFIKICRKILRGFLL